MIGDGTSAGGDRGEWKSEEHPLTGLLRSDAVVLMLAHRAVEESGGGPEGDLAARRVLDGEVHAMITWPTGADYRQAADDYDRAGRPGDAALLRRIAATDVAIEATRNHWNTRYDGRPRTDAQQLIYGLRKGGFIDFDPAGPYLGVDGAVYEPGMMTVGTQATPVLVVSGRGSSEFLIDWPDYSAMSQWIASRGSTGAGELGEPPARSEFRGWHEDAILARLAATPEDVLLAGRMLEPDAFTTDVRYEIYQSILTVTARGQGGDRDAIDAELTRRIANVPPYGLVNYGGVSGLFARAYLARLAATYVTHERFMDAAATVAKDDERDRARMARTTARPSGAPATVRGLAADPQSGLRHGSIAPAPKVGLPRPPEAPGIQAGPVQR